MQTIFQMLLPRFNIICLHPTPPLIISLHHCHWIEIIPCFLAMANLIVFTLKYPMRLVSGMLLFGEIRGLCVLYQFRVLKAARARSAGKAENDVEDAGC